VNRRYRARVPDTDLALLDATAQAELIRRGDVSQQSFTFMRPGKEDEEWKRLDGHTFRTLKRLHVLDVSPVTFPAYPTTNVHVRTADDVLAEHEASTEPPVDRQDGNEPDKRVDAPDRDSMGRWYAKTGVISKGE